MTPGEETTIGVQKRRFRGGTKQMTGWGLEKLKVVEVQTGVDVPEVEVDRNELVPALRLP